MYYIISFSTSINKIYNIYCTKSEDTQQAHTLEEVTLGTQKDSVASTQKIRDERINKYFE